MQKLKLNSTESEKKNISETCEMEQNVVVFYHFKVRLSTLCISPIYNYTQPSMLFAQLISDPE